MLVMFNSWTAADAASDTPIQSRPARQICNLCVMNVLALPDASKVLNTAFNCTRLLPIRRCGKFILSKEQRAPRRGEWGRVCEQKV